VNLIRSIIVLAAATAIGFVPASAIAQRQPPTPEQRIQRLERQVDEMQRRLFPKGRPADTAGYSDDPAATQSSVMSLDQRLDALEHQMTDMLRQTEDNGNRLRSVENSVGQLRNADDQRIGALEQRMSAAEAAVPAASTPQSIDTTPPATTSSKTATPPKSKPKPITSPKAAEATATAVPAGDEGAAGPVTDPGEEAYTQGFHQWEAGDFDQAIGTLRDFVKTYPKHKRVSYANNLIGRAQLDKGDARSAAETLLSNYRNNPGGDRAPDSLFYLGQALTKLGQPAQACKAYSELDAVYGAKIRPDLKKLEIVAKTQANCG
jgi:TolA-binding protein